MTLNDIYINVDINVNKCGHTLFYIRKKISNFFLAIGTCILSQFFWHNYTVPICYLYAIALLFFPLNVKKTLHRLFLPRSAKIILIYIYVRHYRFYFKYYVLVCTSGYNFYFTYATLTDEVTTKLINIKSIVFSKSIF